MFISHDLVKKSHLTAIDQGYSKYSWLLNVTTMRKDPHACTIGWNIDSNKPHASPGLYNSNAFVVIKASPISSQKSHIVLNKPHASLFGHCIEMNKPSVRNKAIGCYIPQSRVGQSVVWRFLAENTQNWYCQGFNLNQLNKDFL